MHLEMGIICTLIWQDAVISLAQNEYEYTENAVDKESFIIWWITVVSASTQRHPSHRQYESMQVSRILTGDSERDSSINTVLL
jgi:hypothetical protein